MNKNALFFHFIEENESQLKFLLESTKQFLYNPLSTVNNESIVIMLEFLKELSANNEMIDQYFCKEELEEVKALFSSFIHEEKDLVLNYYEQLNKKNNQEIITLTKIEWKFIGITTCENLEKGIVIPKVMIKLYLSDGSETVLESDFATIKKFQEEIEESASGFNSTYARRIETFAK